MWYVIKMSLLSFTLFLMHPDILFPFLTAVTLSKLMSVSLLSEGVCHTAIDIP